MFVDSHCHLTYEPLKNNIAKIIEKCDNTKVTNLFTIGKSIKCSLKCTEISKVPMQITINTLQKFYINLSSIVLALNNPGWCL